MSYIEKNLKKSDFFERTYRSSRIGTEIIVCRAAAEKLLIKQEMYYMPLTETGPYKKTPEAACYRPIPE